MSYSSAAVVTAHSSNPNIFDALLVMAGGTLTVVPQQGAAVTLTLPAAGAGTVYPLEIKLKTKLVTAAPANTVGLKF